MSHTTTLKRYYIEFTRSLAEDLDHLQSDDLTIENFRVRARAQLLDEWNEAANGDEVLAVFWPDEPVTLLPEGDYLITGVVYLPESEDQPVALIQTFYDNYGISGSFTLPVPK